VPSGWGGFRMQAFLVSLLAGVFLPLMPIYFELVIRDVRVDTWTGAAITYTAALGLASRNQSVMVGAWVVAVILAFVYGGELVKEPAAAEGGIGRIPWLFSSIPAQLAMLIFAAAYVMERFARHVLEARPFLDMRP
jgi:hypothetical protein